MTSGLRVFLAATALLAAASTSRASVVLSDNLSSFGDGVEWVTGSYYVTSSFGTDAHAYNLTSVVLPVSLLIAGSGSDAQVDIYTSVGAGVGQPGVVVGSLTSPGSISTAITELTFTASGIALSPSSTYWVVVKGVAGSEVHWEWTMDRTGSGVGFQGTFGYSFDAGLSWTVLDAAPQKMQVNAEPVGPWTDLGFALPGVSGAPHLSGTGTLESGSSGFIQLSSAATSAPAVLFVSTSSTPSLFKGGTLLTVPVLVTLPVPTDFLGEAVLSWTAWPAALVTRACA